MNKQKETKKSTTNKNKGRTQGPKLVGRMQYGYIVKPFLDPKPRYKDRWKMELVLEGDQIDKAKDLGLVVKSPVEGNEFLDKPFVSLKRNLLRPDGSENYPPVLLVKKDSLPEGTYVGNGSLVEVELYLSKYEGDDGNDAFSPIIQVVKVIDLVPYTPEREENEYENINHKKKVVDEEEIDEASEDVDDVEEENDDEYEVVEDDDFDDDIPF